MPNRLRITELFYSIQGESQSVGLPTVFVRFTGCPLRCTYCDTTYAFHGGEQISIPGILEKIKVYNTSYVTVTGGEPLAQKPCVDLLKLLCDARYTVSLETSGALSLRQVDPRVIKVMDLKTPSSGECEKNLFTNLQYLTAQDQLKFVIGNRADYLWAKDMIDKHQIDGICEILMSPSYRQVTLKSLADWILQDQLRVRLQTQLHKLIWGDEPGR